jgi:hypothetical protein
MPAFEQVSGVGVGSGEAEAVGLAGGVVGVTEGVPHATSNPIMTTTAGAPAALLGMGVIRADPPKRDGGIVMCPTRPIGSR